MDNRKYKFEIGQKITDNNRDLTIIDREIRARYQRYYKYHCNKCGNEDWKREGHLLRTSGCNVCNRSQKVIKGINDIATTDPELIKYFDNIEESYIYSRSSAKKVLCRCPICNNTKTVKIYDLTRNNGFACTNCSDNFPYTEKFMYNVLKELNINFINQLSSKYFNWCGSYRYDFYFELNNKKYIIETHGRQHYVDMGYKYRRTLQEEQENDKNKKELALKNNIDSYIVIDCKISSLEYIKENILKSELNNIFDLSKINWNKCDKNALNNIIKEICDYWHLHNEINNEDISCKELAEYFGVSSNTINRSLKRGNMFGWCSYNPEEERIKRQKQKQSIKISIFKNGEKLGSFNSIKELSQKSKDIFETYLETGRISKAMKKNKEYKGFTFKREN